MSEASKAVSVLSAIFAARPFAAATKGAVWAASSGKRLSESATRAFGKSREPPVPDGLPDEPAARFAAMQQMHFLTDRQITDRCRAVRVYFLSYLAAAAALLVWAVVSPSLGLAPFGIPLAPWAVFILAAAKVVRFSHLHHHLRTRRLTPFRVWVRDPANILLPVFETGQQARQAARAAATALAFVVFAPACAWAATGDIITALTNSVSTGDLSLQWLYRIFPSVFPLSGVTQQQDAIAGMFGLVNSGLLAAACFMLTWETMSGVVHAAHNGKAFSDRYHALYAPIRVFIGIGSLVPVAGYCMAQLLIIYIALGGYKIANTVWVGYLGIAAGMQETAGPGLSGEGRWAVMPGGGAVSVPPDLVAQLPAFVALLSSETCYQAARWDSRTIGQSQSPPAQPVARGSLGLAGATRQPFKLPPEGGEDVPGGKRWDYGQVCGSITWTVRPAAAAPTVQQSLARAGGAYVTVPEETKVTEREGYLRDFDIARADAFGRLVTKMRSEGPASIAASLASPGYLPDGNTDIRGKLTAVLEAYSTFKSELLAASSTLSAKLNSDARASMMDRASKLGWAAAGAFQPAQVRANKTVTDRVLEGPSIEAPNPDALAVSANMRNIYGTAQRQLSEALYAAVPNSTSSQRVTGGTSGFPEIDTVRDLRTNPESSLSTWMSRLSERIFVSLQNMAKLDPTDPISSIQNHGQAMEATLVGGWATWQMINAVAGAGEKISDGVSHSIAGWFGAGAVTGAIAGAIKGVVAGLAGFVTTFFWWAFALAALYSTVLPMLGYVFWMFGVVGCIVLLVESVAGAAFWAFAHVRTDGSGEFVGPAQRHGYSIAFNMLFRPTLMIIGLVLGHVVFAVTAGFVNATFGLAAGAAFSGEAFYGSRIMSPVSILVLMATLFYIHYQLAVRSYSLITQLPDRVARWSGASGENLGEEGHFGEAHNTIVGGVVRQSANFGQGARAFGNSGRDAQQQQRVGPGDGNAEGGGQQGGSVKPAPGGKSPIERTATAAGVRGGG